MVPPPMQEQKETHPLPDVRAPLPKEKSAEDERREFEQAFEVYVGKVKDFQAAYKAGRGALWPAKEARAMLDAWRKVVKLQPLLVEKKSTK
jgi:hypothetical protein